MGRRCREVEYQNRVLELRYKDKDRQMRTNKIREKELAQLIEEFRRMRKA